MSVKGLTSPLQEPPNTIDYLNLVKEELSTDKSALLAFLSDLDEWIWQRLGLGESFSVRSLIFRIAKHLRFKPRLLYGLNSLLRPHYRLECLTADISEVNFFVLIDGTSACILSFLRNNQASLPATDVEVRALINSKENWEKLRTSLDVQYLSCLAQVLQEILDNDSTDSGEHRIIKQRLIQLANECVLPPSVFAHFILPSGQNPAALSVGSEFTNGGGFTDVYRKVIKQVPTCFRVIRVFESSDTVKLHKEFCGEVIIWRQLKHINILPFFGATVELFPKRFCFILPWFRNGSIMSFLSQNPGHDRLMAISQVVDALDYLHSLDPPLIHKDIKGANVLVRDDRVCVLSDFGLSKHLDSDKVSSAPKGSLNWMAPEVFDISLMKIQDNRPSDIYSLGCTIYEILTEFAPFAGQHPAAVMRKILFDERPVLPQSGNWPETHMVWSLVSRCWAADPQARPTIQSVKKALRYLNAASPLSQLSQSKSNGEESEFEFISILNWLRQEIHGCAQPSPWSQSLRPIRPVFTNDVLPHVIITACS